MAAADQVQSIIRATREALSLSLSSLVVSLRLGTDVCGRPASAAGCGWLGEGMWERKRRSLALSPERRGTRRRLRVADG
jgi:hypothetical protein